MGRASPIRERYSPSFLTFFVLTFPHFSLFSCHSAVEVGETPWDGYTAGCRLFRTCIPASQGTDTGSRGCSDEGDHCETLPQPPWELGTWTGAGWLENFRFLFFSAQRREERRTAGRPEAYLLHQLSRGMQAKAEKALRNQDKCRPRACKGLW